MLQRSFSISRIKIHTHTAHKQDLQSNERTNTRIGTRKKNTSVIFHEIKFVNHEESIRRSVHLLQACICECCLCLLVSVCLLVLVMLCEYVSISYSQFIGAMIFGAVIEMASYMVVICVYGFARLFTLQFEIEHTVRERKSHFRRKIGCERYNKSETKN